MSDDLARNSPLDRDLQRDLLMQMRRRYPLPAEEYAEAEEPKLIANLVYLEEHGLCESSLDRALLNAPMRLLDGPTITARGLDFLEDDGGVGAILGVVTVRVHADTLRELIALKIEAAAAAPEEKSVLRKHLATLSDVTLRAAAADLVRLGLDHLPDVLGWLQRF